MFRANERERMLAMLRQLDTGRIWNLGGIERRQCCLQLRILALKYRIV
jgi:hypothetical protein